MIACYILTKSLNMHCCSWKYYLCRRHREILDAVTVSQSICLDLDYCCVCDEIFWWCRNDPWCCYCFTIYLFEPWWVCSWTYYLCWWDKAIFDAVNASQSIFSNLAYCWVCDAIFWWGRNNPWCCYCFRIYLFKPYFLFVNLLFLLVRQSNPWCCYCFTINLFGSWILLGLQWNWLVGQKLSLMLLLLHNSSVQTIVFVCEPIIFVGKTERSLILFLLHLSVQTLLIVWS